MKSIPVVVTLDDVKLKLTCTEALLQKALVDAVITPFLGAYNKKRNASVAAAQLSSVHVDGREVCDVSVKAADVFGGTEAPTVELSFGTAAPAPSPPTALPASDGAARECKDAVARLLELPAHAPVEAWAPPLHVLCIHSHDSCEAPGVADCLLVPRVVLYAAQRACVADEALLPAGGTVAASEAATLLNNLLKMDRARAGGALAGADSRAVPDIIALLSEAPKIALSRLRQFGQICFQLSLLPAVASGPYAEALTGAVRSALAWASVTVRYPSPTEHAPEDVGHVAAFAADACRTAFNLLRSIPNDGSSKAKRLEIESWLSSMIDVLGAAPGPGHHHHHHHHQQQQIQDAIKEAQLACLQIGVVLPVEMVYTRLQPAWPALLALLTQVRGRRQIVTDCLEWYLMSLDLK
jgi:hypothetical protein